MKLKFIKIPTGKKDTSFNYRSTTTAIYLDEFNKTSNQLDFETNFLRYLRVQSEKELNKKVVNGSYYRMIDN